MYNYEKTLQVGIVVLFIGFLVSLCAILGFFVSPSPPISMIEKRDIDSQSVKTFSLPLEWKQEAISFPIPNIEGELSVSFERVRPGFLSCQENRYLIRIKKNGQVRKVTLPARLDLKYENGLQFSDSIGSFWVDFSAVKGKDVSAVLYCLDPEGKVLETGSFLIKAEECSLKSSLEFREGTPFRLLSESHLLGRDLFLEKYENAEHSQRLVMGGSEWISLKEGDWIGYLGGKWQKLSSTSDANNIPLARVSFFDDRTLVFDAWDLDEYFRLSVSSCPSVPLKTKLEEFMASVRIRSEKQISCMLDKQCFVLRSGDWVLKENSRWKVLRKAQERQAYLQGELVGDLFVFDRIENRNGQKMVEGFLFNTGRSLMVPVEIAVNSLGKNGQISQASQSRRAKGK